MPNAEKIDFAVLLDRNRLPLTNSFRNDATNNRLANAISDAGRIGKRYHHNRTGEDNADAHHKRQIMGREVVVAVTAGKLDFRPWEQIFYGAFDGRRKKRVLVKIIGE